MLIADNGHVRQDAGVFQWLSPNKQRLAQVHGYVESAVRSDANWVDHLHVVPEVEREDSCLVFIQKPAKE